MRRAAVVNTLLVLSVLLSLTSIIVLDWAHYGDFGLGLERFPGWQGHVAVVLAFYLCVGWTILRSRIPIVLAVTALAAMGSATLFGTLYDDATYLFGRDAIIPMVMPRPGLGPVVAVLAILLGWAAVTGWRPASAHRDAQVGGFSGHRVA